MKIWEKGIPIDQEVERFTVGEDRHFDLFLAPYDILGSIAHVKMLASVGLLDSQENEKLVTELRLIFRKVEAGEFEISDQVEDVHSMVEWMLTEKLGDAGKKIHTGRSRNDQVLTDLKLFFRKEIRETVLSVQSLVETLLELSAKYEQVLMPGYTHMQVAMPSSFGLWLSAFAEGLIDDLLLLRSIHDLVNQNPLGSAAGFGSSVAVDRDLTTELLGFRTPHINSIYAMMNRGKAEKQIAIGLSGLASTLNKLAYDGVLYSGQDFGFISFPDAFTTGSSIMPHKKNPDVLELVRGRCSILQALPVEVGYLTHNLPTGYHREMQLLKEHLFPAFEQLRSCLRMTEQMFKEVEIAPDLLSTSKYELIFSVEEVNRLQKEGIPFRDAYRQVAKAIKEGNLHPDKEVNHTHLGSVGNLALDRLQKRLIQTMEGFAFETWQSAEQKLLQD